MTDPAAVEPLLRAVQPAARLVRARHVARARRELGELGDPLPVWVPRHRLAALDFTPAVDPGHTPAVLLLPTPDDLTPRQTGAALLRTYWRLLVQADILRTFADLPDATAAERLVALGDDAAAEVWCVLTADRLVPPDAKPAGIYRAFAAVAADALAFDPDRFGRLFPLLAADEPLRRRLADELHLVPTVTRLKPFGSAPALSPPPPPARTIGGFVRDVSASAVHAFRRGNRVRAAVTLARAGDKAAARTLRDGLVADLARTLGWDAATTDRWDGALRPLLTAAAGADWGRATRCLYDLQRIVTDLSGELTALDPFGWAISLGRRPLPRSLPLARPVRLLRHLATAREHLRQADVPAADRDRLDHLLSDAQHDAETQVRAGCEPVVRGAVVAAGLTPTNSAERVALAAVAAELLDRVAERGFARFADLRDAVARNALKLPDLTGLGEWWRGDALLRADRRLGAELAGVYRPAEVYLRAVHRCTTAAFGTAVGRWLSLWVVLPFGGGVMAVEFAKYMALEVTHLRGWVRGLFPHDAPALPVGLPDPLDDYLDDYTEAAVEQAHAGMALTRSSLLVALALGLLFLALIHHPVFRRRVVWAAGAVVRLVFLWLPAAAWASPPVRAVRTSRAVRVAWQQAGTAVLVAATVVVGLALAGAGWPRLVGWAGATFAVVLLGTHTPPGRRLEEDAAEALADGWRAVRHGLLPGLVAGVVELFRAVADRVERGLYAVDEWLRFRDRDARPTLAVKAVGAAVWLPVAYIQLFAFYLLIEPQANPVKHFPVVTVSHKLLLPSVPTLSGVLGLPVGTTTALVSLVPGVFGFIAWELKESWRLYAANRPAVPPPVPVGHHGETVRGLLVPGFHSGTVPKLFARLRGAADPGRIERAGHGLHAIEHDVGRFVERHLVAVLRDCPSWAGLTPTAGPVRLGVRTVGVTLAVPELGDGLLTITFADEDGTVRATVRPADWQPMLVAGQTTALREGVERFIRSGSAVGVEGLEPPTSSL